MTAVGNVQRAPRTLGVPAGLAGGSGVRAFPCRCEPSHRRVGTLRQALRRLPIRCVPSSRGRACVPSARSPSAMAPSASVRSAASLLSANVPRATLIGCLRGFDFLRVGACALSAFALGAFRPWGGSVRARCLRIARTRSTKLRTASASSYYQGPQCARSEWEPLPRGTKRSPAGTEPRSLALKSGPQPSRPQADLLCYL